MTYSKVSSLIINIIVISCFSQSFFFNNIIFAKETEKGKKVIIDLDFLPSDVRPGDKPISLAPNRLAAILPELKNPRLMSLQDLDNTKQEKETFIEDGYTFVLRGDFNKDGYADIVFVGKYDNPENPIANSFVAIITFKKKKVIRDFFLKIGTEKILLLRKLNYKPKSDAIFMVFNLDSEDCGYLYSTGKSYKFEICKAVFP